MSAARADALVLGAGAWGTALACLLAANGARTALWAYDPAEAEAIRRDGENRARLPGVALPDAIEPVSGDQPPASDLVVVVTPAQTVRATLRRLAPALGDAGLVLCAKGIEHNTLLFMSQTAAEVCAETGARWPLAVLSGPSFAADVARGLPTAVTLACADEAFAARAMAAFGGPTFRPYLSADVIGAELGGAVKNVLAIACGVAHGLGLGESARAALITRGFAEMRRLGSALGAQPETLQGLSGLGDLILTCSSMQSRNFSLGAALGEGGEALERIRKREAVAEGALTAPALAALAAREGVDMPIAEAVLAILEERLTPRDAVAQLLSRPLKAEHA